MLLLSLVSEVASLVVFLSPVMFFVRKEGHNHIHFVYTSPENV